MQDKRQQQPKQKLRQFQVSVELHELLESYHWRGYARGVGANLVILLGKWVGSAQEVAVLSDYFHIRIIFLTVGAQGDHLHHSRCEEILATGYKI